MSSRRNRVRQFSFILMAVAMLVALLPSFAVASDPETEYLPDVEVPVVGASSGVQEAELVPLISPALQPDGWQFQNTDSEIAGTFAPLRSGEGMLFDNSSGVHANFLSKTVVDEVIEMGASWIRVSLQWSQIEPQNTTPEHYQWNAYFDNCVALLSASGVKVIFTLDGNPSWAATYEAGPVDKVDISELSEFMRAAAAHYGPPPYNVKHWEIYNEPDNSSSQYASTGQVGYFGNQPDVYVQTLKAIHQAVKAVDPEAQILLGGLAYDRWSPEGPFIKDFIDKVIQNGGAAYFDVMNFHYYVPYRDNWDPYGPGLTGKATALRQKLASYGVNKPFVCTETSMWSDEQRGSSLEIQARHVPKVFARTMAAGLQNTIWYRLFDTPKAGARKFGLLDMPVSRKPSYYAFQTFSEQMSWTRYVRTLDPAETGSSQIEAYQFATVQGTFPVVVAWTDDDITRQMTLEAAQVARVDKFGASTTIRDGDDGAVDGRIQVAVGPSPVYLRFQEPLQENTLTILTSGQGTVAKEPDQATYPGGSVVTLTASPDSGWRFLDWSGASASELLDNRDGTWSLVMDGDKELKAIFQSTTTSFGETCFLPLVDRGH